MQNMADNSDEVFWKFSRGLPDVFQTEVFKLFPEDVQKEVLRKAARREETTSRKTLGTTPITYTRTTSESVYILCIYIKGYMYTYIHI